MTRAELEVLSDRELDAICAEKVMGWHLDDVWWKDAEDRIAAFDKPPNFSDSYVLCARVRERITKLGRQEEFIEQLFNGCDKNLNWWWNALNAPPRAQIIAAILAVEEK